MTAAASAARRRTPALDWPSQPSLALLGLLLALLFESAARAEEPPPQLTLHGYELILNGHGARQELWTELYRCALYLPARSSRLEYIMDAGTPKAVHLRILQPQEPNRIPPMLRGALAQELPGRELGDLEAKFAKLDQRDWVVVSYLPNAGSEIWLNGERVLADPGHGLIATVLDYWLGERPPSEDLRRSLLVGSAAVR